MGRNRFVQPETVRLELSDGDWIEVKQRLAYAEEQRLVNAGLRRTVDDGQEHVEIRWDQFRLQRVETWLVDWSLCDAQGKQVRLTPSAIAALDRETAEEINAALDAHIEAADEAKKAMSSANGTAPKS